MNYFEDQTSNDHIRRVMSARKITQGMRDYSIDADGDETPTNGVVGNREDDMEDRISPTEVPDGYGRDGHGSVGTTVVQGDMSMDEDDTSHAEGVVNTTD